MTTTVYVFFPGRQEGDAPGDIASWEMFHWPAEVVEALLPQAVWHRATSVSVRHLRERLAAALALVEAAVATEEYKRRRESPSLRRPGRPAAAAA